MASSMASMAPLRYAVPRAGLSLHSKQLRARLLPFAAQYAVPLRYASSDLPKPRVLAKPDRFNPPSHGSRLPRRQQPRAYPGAPLTAEQRTKRYPNMMPAEGTRMHAFLTNRMLHVWITLSILVSLVLTIWITDFHTSTPYTHLLPPNSLFLSHPLQYLRRYAEVYQMHVDYTSQQTAERRRQKVEDVRKRSEFRRAHGLEGDEGTLGGWKVRGDEEVMGPGMREGGEVGGFVSAAEVGRPGGEDEVVRDFEGKAIPVKKKWLGIW